MKGLHMFSNLLRIIFLAIAIFFLAMEANASAGARPLIFILSRENVEQDGEKGVDVPDIVKLLKAAIAQSPRITDNSKIRLANWVENIVLLETEKTFILFFFTKYNGRELDVINDKAVMVLPSAYKIETVELDRKTLLSIPRQNQSYSGFPCPLYDLGGIEPAYSDLSEAEGKARSQTSKTNVP